MKRAYRPINGLSALRTENISVLFNYISNLYVKFRTTLITASFIAIIKHAD